MKETATGTGWKGQPQRGGQTHHQEGIANRAPQQGPPHVEIEFKDYEQSEGDAAQKKKKATDPRAWKLSGRGARLSMELSNSGQAIEYLQSGLRGIFFGGGVPLTKHEKFHKKSAPERSRQNHPFFTGREELERRLRKRENTWKEPLTKKARKGESIVMSFLKKKAFHPIWLRPDKKEKKKDDERGEGGSHLKQEGGVQSGDKEFTCRRKGFLKKKGLETKPALGGDFTISNRKSQRIAEGVGAA